MTTGETVQRLILADSCYHNGQFDGEDCACRESRIFSQVPVFLQRTAQWQHIYR